MPTKHVLISGGAGGLGGSSARHLAGKGWRVFAADLPGTALDAVGREQGITSLPLDVTDSESVERAVAVVHDQSGGLDGVVNFAGILALGSMAEIAVEKLFQLINNPGGEMPESVILEPELLVRKSTGPCPA